MYFLGIFGNFCFQIGGYIYMLDTFNVNEYFSDLARSRVPKMSVPIASGDEENFTMRCVR
jgi:hypothetical protein